MNKIFKKILAPFSSAAYQQDVRNSTNIRLQLQKRALESTCEYVENHMSHIVSVTSREAVLLKALQSVKIPGLYCEFGVYQGYTLNYIQSNATQTIHGFDSFKGLPEFWIDGFDKNAFELPQTPQFAGDVQIHEGYYEDSLPTFVAKHQEAFAFLHIDCDLYSSTKTIFDLCKDRIVPGTVISFDEYFNYPGWQNGEYKAFQEFVKSNGLKYEYITYNALHLQVAIRIIG
jgi:predicted O-methyltransferase YrrM